MYVCYALQLCRFTCGPLRGVRPAHGEPVATKDVAVLQSPVDLVQFVSRQVLHDAGAVRVAHDVHDRQQPVPAAPGARTQWQTVTLTNHILSVVSAARAVILFALALCSAWYSHYLTRDEKYLQQPMC